MIRFNLNGKDVSVDRPGENRLLWAIREELKLTGTKFGCGAGLCGACTVHVDGEPVASCGVALSEVDGKAVRTIEGLAPDSSHPLQQAWIAEGVPQCGYCQSGQIMRAAGLLAKNKNPTREEIVEYMQPNLCRCGTYLRIIKAIQRAARSSQ